MGNTPWYNAISKEAYYFRKEKKMTELELMRLLKCIEGQSRRDMMPPPPCEPPADCNGDAPPPLMNIHHGKGRILSVLFHHEGMTQKELAEHISVRPQSLSDSLARLEEEGLICRERSEKDKRELLLFLTDRGKTHAEEIRIKRREHAEEFFSVLSDEEKETLGTLLTKLFEANENCCDRQKKINQERQDHLS